MIPATLQSPEAERGAIASLLLKPTLTPETLGTLSAEDFTSDLHRRFFEAAKKAFTGGKQVDLVSVLTALRESGNLRTDDPGHLAQLTSLAIVPGLDHCRTVERLAKARSFLRDLEQARTSLLAGSSLDTVIEDFSPAIQKTAERDNKATLLRDILSSEVKSILQRAENGGRLPGISTGFPDIDRLTGGLVPSNLIVLAARPAMGKSTLALNIAENVARAGIPTAFFSLEMSRSELAEKILAHSASVPLSRLRDGSFSGQEAGKVNRAAENLRSVPLYLYDRPGLSIHYLTAIIKGLHMRHGLGLVVVDYLQLMRGEGKTREQEVASLSRGLKCLAMELNIPVLALSQLNRTLENRTDKKPALADLRDSGAIEQDANIVAFIYRDEVYNSSPNNPHRGIAEVIVAKNRSGPTGAVRLSSARLSYSEFSPLSNR